MIFVSSWNEGMIFNQYNAYNRGGWISIKSCALPKRRGITSKPKLEKKICFESHCFLPLKSRFPHRSLYISVSGSLSIYVCIFQVPFTGWRSRFKKTGRLKPNGTRGCKRATGSVAMNPPFRQKVWTTEGQDMPSMSSLQKRWQTCMVKEKGTKSCTEPG